MIRTPKEQAEHDMISSYTNPLEEKINEQGKEIEELRKIILVDQEEYRSTIIEDFCKTIPLYTRFKVFLEMQHLNLTIEQDKHFTDEQMDEANEWAIKTTHFLLKQLKEWEDDGKPEDRMSKGNRTIPNVPPEDRSRMSEGVD